MSNFDDLVSDFGNTIGIPGLKADNSGICMLAFDDIEIVIQHIENGDMLLLYGYLGAIPPDYQEDLFSYLLCANSFFRDTAGSTIGIDKTTNAIGLHIAYPLVALDNVSFENLLENFVNMAEGWIEKIERFPAILNETGSAISASPLQEALDRQSQTSAQSLPPAGGIIPPVGNTVQSTPPSTGRPQGSPPPPPSVGRPQGSPPPPPSTGRPQGSPPPPPSVGRPQGSPPPPPSGIMPPKK